MNLASISSTLFDAGKVIESETKFDSVAMEQLKLMSNKDTYAAVVLQALEANKDCETDLYLHQFQALYALAQGKDVLLSSPCGFGKTRVLENASMVAKLGFEMKSEIKSQANPLGIVCCPLTAIIEDKIKDQPKAGMLSMYGRCQTMFSENNKVCLSRSEDEFLTDQLSLIYGHPESFATEMGKKILESNEERIFVFVCDEVGFNIWGPDFRILMSNIPASI